MKKSIQFLTLCILKEIQYHVQQLLKGDDFDQPLELWERQMHDILKLMWWLPMRQLFVKIEELIPNNLVIGQMRIPIGLIKLIPNLDGISSK